MKSYLALLSFIALATIAYSKDASANGVLVRPRIGASYTSYSLNLASNSSNTPVATSHYFSPVIGITIAKNGFYADLYGSSSINATQNWPGGFAGDFKRYDSALTLGLLLNAGWSVFAGYKYGISEFYQYNYPAYRLTFKATGPFVGGSYAHPLSAGNSISVSAALADMNGKVYDTGNINDSGNSIGISLAATYNVSTSTRTGVQFKGFYQNYKYSGFSSVVNAKETIEGLEADFHFNF